MKINLLDHGYVEFIEAWGTGKCGRDQPDSLLHDAPEDHEVGIVEAARQSTQGSFRGWDQDAKLLKHLHDHCHATPFEFAGMVIEVQAPLMVFREWHRHRTQSYNEMSARYAQLPDLYYVPSAQMLDERGQKAGTTRNKQEAGVAPWNQQKAFDWLNDLTDFYVQAEALYARALHAGVPKELARVSMPVGHYTRMRAVANLRNWLAFMTLRCAPAAQWEIRQYAQAVAQIVQSTFPHTYVLWTGAPCA